jgi:fucose permease
VSEPHTVATSAQRWRVALSVIFGTCGFISASWLSRLPTIRNELGVSTGTLGLVIFGMSLGSLVGLVVATNVIERIGARQTIVVAAVVDALGLPAAAVGAALHLPAMVFAGLALYGLGFAMIDVSMNVSGAANEHAVRRTIMPMFHAVFSLGTVAGIEVGALLEATRVPVLLHLSGTAVVGLIAVLISARWLGSERADVDRAASDLRLTRRMSVAQRLRSWREPRTLALGVVVLGMTFAQGAGNNWLPLAMVDDRGFSHSAGDEVLGVFLVAMTAGRFIAGSLVDRFGRVAILRSAAVVAALGVVLVITVPSPIAAFAGAALWGAGVSLGFPLGMSAAADDPHRAAARIAAVAIIGTFASLTGPPLIGFVADGLGVTGSFAVVIAVIGISGALSQAARPLTKRARGY